MSDVDEFFAGKPAALAVFEVLRARIEAMGPCEVSVGSQISFGCARKFAWVWLYNVTQRNPSGVVHLMLALGEPVDDPHVRDVSRIGKSRWNHQIVVRSVDDAGSVWLGELIERAYQYGSG